MKRHSYLTIVAIVAALVLSQVSTAFAQQKRRVLNNGIGVVGVAPEARIWAVKVLGDDGSGSTTDIAQGIEWCIDKGDIRVISMAKVIYVDADAPGPFHTGSIWAYAYKHIQDALSEANASAKPVEIHVAQGIYRPDETSTYPGGTSDRSAAFQLINGVTLKGGYAGNGQPDPDERDISVYETILSGDLSGNDVPVTDPCDLLTEPTRVENSLHVLTGSGCDETAVLDGFTVTGGNANSGYPNDAGGGMRNHSGSPTVVNCSFISNSGMWGGGLENFVASEPTITGCNFRGNAATVVDGGGINNNNSNPTLTNCTFIGNWAKSFGGGMSNRGASSPMLTGCKFFDNFADMGGGGMRNIYSSNPMLTNCLFSENQAAGWGGGGGMFNMNSSPTMKNCTFSRNVSISFGGGGLSNLDRSSSFLTNCVVWDNTAPSDREIHNDLASSTIVKFSDVRYGWFGEGNINTDPYFADASNGDFHLKSEAGRWNPDSESWIIDSVTSPCIDSGDFASDWRGELWPHGCLINMGAYGGTPEASMSLYDAGSIADIDVDGQIDGMDTKLLIDKWLFEEILLPEDLNRDGKVNFTDYAIFAYIRGLPSPATNPNPTDRAMFVSVTADLTWTAGSYGTSYNVYFGTNNPPPFIGNQSTTAYDPSEMDYSTTYYWRIDAVGDAGKTNGLVWSFTTFSSPPPPPP